MKDWKETLALVIAEENKSCKIVFLYKVAAMYGIDHIDRQDALDIMRKAKQLRSDTKLMRIMNTKNDSLFRSICLVDKNIYFEDEEEE